MVKSALVTSVPDAVNRYTTLNERERASNKTPPCSNPSENPHTVNISVPIRTSSLVHVTEGAAEPATKD